MNEPTQSLRKLYENMLEQMTLAMEEDPNAGFIIQQLFATASAAVVEQKERAIPLDRARIRHIG